MPRRKYERRPFPAPDSIYFSVLVSRLINKLNFCGEKMKASKNVYQALEYVKDKTKEEPLAILAKAIENVRPQLVTKGRQVGGATYQVPTEVHPERGETIAMRWLIDFAAARKGAAMHTRLGEEILQAARREGAAFKKREETHKMAESNRAFAHYRW
ncbi:MAG: 30S ribosomal protein S7 [Elusimicrobiota bacterium]